MKKLLTLLITAATLLSFTPAAEAGHRSRSCDRGGHRHSYSRSHRSHHRPSYSHSRYYAPRYYAPRVLIRPAFYPEYGYGYGNGYGDGYGYAPRPSLNLSFGFGGGRCR